MNKSELKTIIDTSIRVRRPTEEAIQKFVDDLDAGLNSGWAIFTPAVSLPVSITMLSPVADLVEFGKLKKLSKDLAERTQDKEQAILNSSLKLQKQLNELIAFSKLNEHEPYNDEQWHAMNEVITSLKTVIPILSSKKTRQSVFKSTLEMEAKLMLAAYVCAMAECLLSVRIYPNKGNSPLAKVLIACFRLALVDHYEEVETCLDRCYDSEEVLSRMYSVYRHYNELEKFHDLINRGNLSPQSKAELTQQWSLGE